VKILFIDDHPYSMKNALLFMREKGDLVDCPDVGTCNWIDLLEHARKSDVMVLDLKLEPNNLFDDSVRVVGQMGEEILRRIRSAHCRIPVVILSRLAPEGADRVRLQRLGVTLILAKSQMTSLNEFRETLSRVAASAAAQEK